jgi:hypothetical protein
MVNPCYYQNYDTFRIRFILKDLKMIDENIMSANLSLFCLSLLLVDIYDAAKCVDRETDWRKYAPEKV